MELELGGKVALVTGGGQGVGRRISIALAEEGARVAVNDLVQERADRVAGEIAAAGGSASGFAADVTDQSAVRNMVEDIRSTFGSVDVLVNNAGIIPERRTGDVGLPFFAESDPQDWKKITDLNLFGTFNAVHAVLPDMIERKSGKIVSIMSDAGLVGEIRFAVYSGAKAGILAFSKSLAKEVGRHCINVNVVSLAAVSHEAPMADFLSEDATAENNETLAKVLKSYPLGRGLGRLTRPQDAAAAVVFLSSSAAEYITGQFLPVNGGYSMP